MLTAITAEFSLFQNEIKATSSGLFSSCGIIGNFAKCVNDHRRLYKLSRETDSHWQQFV